MLLILPSATFLPIIIYFHGLKLISKLSDERIVGVGMANR